MRLPSNTTVETNVAQAGEFKIAVNSHSFQVLFKNLYADSKLAIMRELLCNAIDAHMMIGRRPGDQAIRIKHPTRNTPMWSIRDYGPGLAENEVLGLYTTVFESTKGGDGRVTGGFGLGSKSPFAYTDSFTVVSFHNGKKQVWNASLDGGIPKIYKIDEEATTEENGLEVIVPVRMTDLNEWNDSDRTTRAYAPAILEGWALDITDCKTPKPSLVLTHGRFSLIKWPASAWTPPDFVVINRVAYQMTDNQLLSWVNKERNQAYAIMVAGATDFVPPTNRESFASSYSLSEASSLTVLQASKSLEKSERDRIVRDAAPLMDRFVTAAERWVNQNPMTSNQLRMLIDDHNKLQSWSGIVSGLAPLSIVKSTVLDHFAVGRNDPEKEALQARARFLTYLLAGSKAAHADIYVTMAPKWTALRRAGYSYPHGAKSGVTDYTFAERTWRQRGQGVWIVTPYDYELVKLLDQSPLVDEQQILAAQKINQQAASAVKARPGKRYTACHRDRFVASFPGLDESPLNDLVEEFPGILFLPLAGKAEPTRERQVQIQYHCTDRTIVGDFNFGGLQAISNPWGLANRLTLGTSSLPKGCERAVYFNVKELESATDETYEEIQRRIDLMVEFGAQCLRGKLVEHYLSIASAVDQKIGSYLYCADMFIYDPAAIRMLDQEVRAHAESLKRLSPAVFMTSPKDRAAFFQHETGVSLEKEIQDMLRGQPSSAPAAPPFFQQKGVASVSYGTTPTPPLSPTQFTRFIP